MRSDGACIVSRVSDLSGRRPDLEGVDGDLPLPELSTLERKTEESSDMPIPIEFAVMTPFAALTRTWSKTASPT